MAIEHSEIEIEKVGKKVVAKFKIWDPEIPTMKKVDTTISADDEKDLQSKIQTYLN